MPSSTNYSSAVAPSYKVPVQKSPIGTASSVSKSGPSQSLPSVKSLSSGSVIQHQRLLKESQKLGTLCQWLYALAFFLFITDLASIALSLDLARRRIIQRRRWDVIGLSILELLCWLLVPCTVWITVSGDAGQDRVWRGWIVLPIWYACLLALGIPRVLFSQEFDGLDTYASTRTRRMSSGEIRSALALDKRLSPKNKKKPVTSSDEVSSASTLGSDTVMLSQSTSAINYGKLNAGMSLETLAMELHIPKLFQLTASGQTTLSILGLNFVDLKALCGITEEEYLRIKTFKKHVDANETRRFH